MLSKSPLKQWIVGVAFGSMSALALAVEQCGEPPAAPAIPDGSTATVEDLAATAEQVNAYAETSDAYLDCIEGYTGKRAFRQLPREEQDAIREKFSEQASSHNATLDSLNQAIADYRAANPEQ